MNKNITNKKYDMDHEMGITSTKNDNFSDWYIQMITKGQFIEYYDISGCYVFLPNSYGIWENIQKFLDSEFKNLGVKNAYFPLFISEKNLNKEKTHIDGFAPEVAWVTKGGNNDLAEKIAVRPTSECAMYPIFSNLIKSHNDLPLKMNQWCNVVRWEFKDCTPFIRNREFLWSELHGCYNSESFATHDVLKVLDLYKQIYNDLLAIPVIKGKKTENEKFAGAGSTYTIEAYIPIIGKGIQAATSHNLAQNFSKMFNIDFQDVDTQRKYVWQISCGITTRSIGIMLMNHGDNKGAIIPPYVAPVQIIIIPIIIKNKKESVLNKCNELYNNLKKKYRVEMDTRNHNPGWKFNYWETQGVPIRIEIGPKDVEKNTITLCKRNDFVKTIVDNDTKIYDIIDLTFKNIHNELYAKAYNELMTNISCPSDNVEFEQALNDKKLCYINWCESDDCENKIKENNKAKPLCIPDDLNINLLDNVCCICEKDSKLKVLFGRSY